MVGFTIMAFRVRLRVADPMAGLGSLVLKAEKLFGTFAAAEARLMRPVSRSILSVVMPKTEKQKMLAGELYHANDTEIVADSLKAHNWCARFNASLGATTPERHALLGEIIGHVGDGVDIRPPFYIDYGYNIRIGAGVFMNFNCIILDVVEVTIGEKTQIGSGVQILTADHPRDPVTRAAGLESGQPVHIGRNVWIGAGALILPGVTIGDDAIIGAGSVVTRDVPPGATAYGNPARVKKP